MFLRDIFHNLGMVNCKFPCSCYSNTSNVNINAHYPFRDNFTEMKGGLNKKI